MCCNFWEMLLLYSIAVSYQANAEPCMSCLATNNVFSNHGDGGRQCCTHIRPASTVCPHRRGCGVGGLDLTQEPTGSLRARTILIRRALVRALIVLVLTRCPVYHWTSQWRAPSLGEGMEEAERGTGGGGVSRLSALYRAPIKGSLSDRLYGPKKGMFILRLGDGLSHGKEWTARGESCLPVRPGMSSSNWPLKPDTVRGGNMEEGRQSSQLEITSKLWMGNEKAITEAGAYSNSSITEVQQCSIMKDFSMNSHR